MCLKLIFFNDVLYYAFPFSYNIIYEILENLKTFLKSKQKEGCTSVLDMNVLRYGQVNALLNVCHSFTIYQSVTSQVYLRFQESFLHISKDISKSIFLRQMEHFGLLKMEVNDRSCTFTGFSHYLDAVPRSQAPELFSFARYARTHSSEKRKYSSSDSGLHWKNCAT